LLMLGLVAVYSSIHLLISRRIVFLGSGSGAVVTTMLLVVVYFAGGAAALAAITFLGLSLIVAGVRAVAGCELMAIPNLLFGTDAELACLMFSPLDRLERKLRMKREG
jgi:hypothetical protein